MGNYSRAAEFYDLLYGGQKDYAAEARLLGDLIREHNPQATAVLDVGCGTGSHARGESTAAGIERRSEVHELGLFTQEQMEAAFTLAGLRVERKPELLRTRGLYIGTAEGPTER